MDEDKLKTHEVVYNSLLQIKKTGVDQPGFYWKSPYHFSVNELVNWYNLQGDRQNLARE